MNKRGFEWGSLAPWLVLGAILLIVLVGTGFISGFEYSYNFEGLADEIGNTQSFADLWNDSFQFFDYIFGQVPSVLVEGTNPISASIIIIGIWFLFFFIFGDILFLFGSFTKTVSWIIAGILTLVIANLKIVTLATVAALGITAVFGALSVIASIVLVFGLFLVFHFSFGAWGRKVRQGIIVRRAEDQALRAVAGGKKVASGATVLKDVSDAAAAGEKK